MIMWVPRNTVFNGNNFADSEAKQAVNSVEIKDFRLSIQDAKT